MSTADGKLQDWLGHDILPGSKIVYPRTRSSSLWMILAEVLEVAHWRDDASLADKWHVKVQPLKSTFYFGHTIDHPVTLVALDRVTVVEC